MTALDDLIERVEKADGPDRELFEQAYLAINGASFAVVLCRHGALGDQPDNEKRQAAQRFSDLLDACAYLDAVMSLVPEGCETTHDYAELGAIKVWQIWWPDDERTRIGNVKTNWRHTEGRSAQHALALLAAALRARKDT